MTKENDNVQEAKKSIKSHIKFLESLLQHLRGADTPYKARAMWAVWCIHRYINDRLMNDIQMAMEQNAKGKEAANDND